MKAEHKTCEWTTISRLHWYGSTTQLSCRKNTLFLPDKSIKLSGYKFCPFCTGKIVEVKNES